MIEKKSPRTIHDEGGRQFDIPEDAWEKGVVGADDQRDATPVKDLPAVVTLLELVVARQFLGGFDFLDNEAGFPRTDHEGINCGIGGENLGATVPAPHVSVIAAEAHEIITWPEATVAMCSERLVVGEPIHLLDRVVPHRSYAHRRP